MYRVGLVALTALAAAVPATAADFVVTIPSTIAIPGNNDFQADLAGEGLFVYTAAGATLSLTGPGRVTFEYMGSESGFIDSFTAGSVFGVEDNKSVWGPELIGTAVFGGGLITDWTFDSNLGLSAVPGDDGFGIFLPRLRDGVTSYQSNVLYFGFDDQINNIDDNHDDFIIRATVTPIPEPATWAMLIFGFGLVGASVRRRRPAVVAA
jgi:hypothetical protein